MNGWWEALEEIKTPPQSCGLFAPLPRHLAKLYPKSEGEDESPKHMTILYIGDLGPKEIRAVQRLLTSELAGTIDSPITATIGRLVHFNNPDKIVAVNKVELDQSLVDIRTYVRILLKKNGIKVEDRYPHDYKPHVTISYYGENQKFWRTDTKTPEWNGPIPQGAWKFDSVEFWIGDQRENNSNNRKVRLKLI